MSDPKHDTLIGPGMMLISAGIFAFFGFTTSWNYTGTQGQFLLFVALLDWTLKGSAIGFAISAGITFANRWFGNLLYGLLGLIGAVLFLVVAVLDIMDTQHMTMNPVILFAFAAWNGYGSWSGLRGVLATRNAGPGREQVEWSEDR